MSSPSQPSGSASSSSSSSTAAVTPREKMHSVFHDELTRLRRAVSEGLAGPLQTGSDELKLQMHLAAHEANDRLHVLERFAERLSRRVENAASAVSETAALKAALANMDLNDAVQARTHRARAELQSAQRTTKQVWQDLELRVGAIAKEVGKYV